MMSRIWKRNPSTPKTWSAPEEDSGPKWQEGYLFDSRPIVAWRGWNFESTKDPVRLFERAAEAPEGENPFAWAVKPLLSGISVPEIWPPMKPTKAHCGGTWHIPKHPAPHVDCGCGLWAVRDAEDIPAVNCTVWGEVYLWGRFFEYERGWRAEYGYPKTICTDREDLVDALLKYGVPVKVERRPQGSTLALTGVTAVTGVTATSAARIVFTTASTFSNPFNAGHYTYQSMTSTGLGEEKPDEEELEE
jgi:hypothetical protein